MKLSIHANRSEALTGLRAEEIHRWIDELFDAESYSELLRDGSAADYDPYSHRKYRHCSEALEDAYKVFESKYTREQIKAVFESHLRDDYGGYLPCRQDFENEAFAEKYHEHDAELEAILSEAELREYFRDKIYSRRPPRLSAGFYWRIVWPTVIAAVLFAASSFTIILPLFRYNIMEQKREMIRMLTQTAASAISFYVHQEQHGLMSRDTAQAEAAAEVSELRYGDDRKDYFWITDMTPTMVMHPYRPTLAGTDLTNYTDTEDKSGKRLFVEFVELVRENGDGYLEYEWQWKDDPTRSALKLSYVCGIPEWDWIIGTGVYIHDVEEEISRLSRNLWIADTIIAIILFGILANLLFQSRRIEQERTQAEQGLVEAKDRYRALVEASGEGSLLEIDGKIIYSNQAMRELTGFSETELCKMTPMELLTESPTNTTAVSCFARLADGAPVSSECEASLRTQSGGRVDVWVSTARIFFSEKQGHVIHFSSLARSQEETLRGFHAPTSTTTYPFDGLNQTIRESQTPGTVIHALRDLPARVRILTDQGIRPELLRHIIGQTFDLTVKQLTTLLPETTALPPVPFAVLLLGSSARHEMTLFSDQDNALIFEDVPEGHLTATRRAFLRLGDQLCGRLKQAGWPYCPGGIMAANPEWCLSVSEWKKRFRQWILNATPQSILEVNVFLDIRCGYGEERLVRELRDYVLDLTQQNPEFLMHYARNCLQYKAPLTMFGHIKTQQSEGRKIIQVKQSIKPLETFARIYALRHGLQETGTCERLMRLQQLEILQEETAQELIQALNHLWQLRFYNQLLSEEGSPAVHDEVDLDRLTELERQTLEHVLPKIAIAQNKLSYDFLGVANQ